MSDLRATLIRQFRARLTEATAHMPDSMALAVPLGTLADAAIAALADGTPVPVVPAYDDATARARHWSGVLRTEELDEGAQYSMLTVRRENEQHVLFMVQHGITAVPVRMPPTDVVDLALAMLSAAYADAPAEPDTSTPEVAR